MKIRRWFGIGLIAGCLLLGMACSLSGIPAPMTEPTQGRESLPAGGIDLAAPANGLKELTAYQQRLEMTLQGQLNGQPYHEQQVLLRTVQGADVAVQVEQVVNDDHPLWLFDAYRSGYRYVQQSEGGACRAEAAPDGAADGGLAQRLPAVFGMQLAGQAQQYNGISALQYTFDQQSLVAADGALKSAVGEVWLAEQGGFVLSYELTAEVQTTEFSGTRSWSYELLPLDEGAPLPMPAACPPVLSDVPILPGGEAVEQQPGFLYYRVVGEQRRTAVTFYAEQLSALGWQALPGAAPDQVYLDGESTALAYRRETVVLIVSLFDRDGALHVVAQTVRMDQAEGAGGVPDVPLMTEEPTNQPPLPQDLPVLTGETVLYETESTRVLQVNSSAADAASFYMAEMEGRGWWLSDRFEHGAMTTLLWAKEDLHLAISIAESGGMTMITIATYSP